MNPRWRLTVEHAFVITGRGSVVIGPLTGIGRNETAVVITPSGETHQIAKVYFEDVRGTFNDGPRSGLVLGHIDREILIAGTVVQSVD